MKQYPSTTNLLVGEIFSRQPRDVRFEITKGTPPAYGRVIDHVVMYEDRIELMLGLFTGVSTDTDRGVFKAKHKSKRGHNSKQIISDSAIVVLKGRIDLVTSGMMVDEEFAELWLNQTEENTDEK